MPAVEVGDPPLPRSGGVGDRPQDGGGGQKMKAYIQSSMRQPRGFSPAPLILTFSPKSGEKK